MHAKTALVLLASLGFATSAMGCALIKAEETEKSAAPLKRVQTCSELESYLKADAAFRMNKIIDRQIEAIEAYGYGNYGPMGGWGGAGESRNGDAMSAPTSGSGGAASGSSSSGGSSSGGSPSVPAADPSGGSSKAGSYSETNTQVKGVDEADFVKTDGKYLYLLHGKELKIVKAWPADQMSEVGSFTIEGSPSEMFLDEAGRVAVYSQANGNAVYKAAGVAPRDASGGGGPVYDSAPVASSGSSGTGGGGGPATTPEPYHPLTKLTVLQVAGNSAQVAREVYFEGNYLSSRRVGNHVRTVLSGAQRGPSLPTWPVDDAVVVGGTTSAGAPSSSSSSSGASDVIGEKPAPYEPPSKEKMIADLQALRAKNLAKIAAAKYGDWLDYQFVKTGAQVTAQTPSCDGFYVPAVGTTEGGMTTVATLDLAAPGAAPKTTSIVGSADTVYASGKAIYVAAHAWIDRPFVGGPAVGAVPPAPPSSGGSTSSSGGTDTTKKVPTMPWLALNATHLHKFELETDPTFATYVASGDVDGSILNQFSLDEHAGKLRVATTAQHSNGVESKQLNHVFVLDAKNGKLEKIGDAGSLAEGERIYSVRFLGDRGYVVTFRQVDPLFALDLSNPVAPHVTGQLKIPGFSEYMHPLGPNHLLTIGRDTREEGGRVIQGGMALQIFDVTNAAAPALAHKFVYNASAYGHSEAESNHKAFTFFDDRKLLAFPYTSYGSGGTKSTLELFKVDAATGFVRLGAIDHSALVKPAAGSCGYYSPAVRRGVFLENVVYSISYGGIVAKSVDALGAAGNTLVLPAPAFYDPYGYGAPSCGGGAGGGATPAPEPVPAPSK
jgi:hypothetical protein